MSKTGSSHLHPAVKAVIFDHDDTLVATFKAKVAEHKYIASKFYGRQITEADVLEHWGKPFSDLVRILYNTDDLDKAFAHNLESHKIFPKILHDDTIDTLTYLKKKGLKLGVVTAANSISFDYDLEALDIPGELFDYIQTEDNSEFHKPDPRVFDPAIKWLEKHKIKSEEVVYVGDGLGDMKAALGAGFEFIGVATGLVTQEEFKQNGARSIKGLADLAN